MQESSSKKTLDDARRLEDSGNLKDAEAIYRRILARSPYEVRAIARLGVLTARRGRPEEAREHFQRAAKLAPGNWDIQQDTAEALIYLEEFPLALNILQKLITARPDHFELWNWSALALIRLGRNSDSISCLQRAVELRPDSAPTLLNLAKVLWDEQRVGEAWQYCSRALAIAPEMPEIVGLAGDIHARRGHLAEAISCYRKALARRGDFAALHSNLLVALNYVPGLSPSELFNEHRAWASVHADSLSERAAPFDNIPDADRCLRIGYVVPELRSHAVTTFFEPLLKNHDRTQFQSYAYSVLKKQDELTKALLPMFSAVRDMESLSDELLSKAIRDDKIDILVDLCGHTKDHRLLAFARRPAPIQVNSVAYPNTTGLKTMDYRFTDAIADPPGEAPCHSEELVRLASGFCCYMPPQVEVPVAPLPASSQGFITFGVTHTLQKLHSEALDLYADVLRAVPTSRLLMFRSTLSPSQQDYFRTEFSRRSIPAERIVMDYKLPPSGSHLNAYDSMDIHLDSFPWNGHTTTCDALWMGVPTITLAGDRHAARMGASVLHRVGLDAFVARNRAEFIEVAKNWAQKMDDLADLRSNLRNRMRNSPLCDGVDYARNVEAEYRKMWTKWCASNAR